MVTRKRTSPIRRGRGFTLIELLIAIAVLGILLTLAVPAFNGFLERHRLKSAVEAAYGDLQFARSEALKRNTEVRVTFTAAAAGTPWCYGLKDEGADCDCNETDSGAADYCEVGGAPQIVSGADYPGSDLSGITFTSNVTTFEPRRGTASGGTVTFSSDQGAYSADITVSSLGRIRICSDDPLGYPGC